MTRSGFSTIEMIIVVILIGIVATLGFPRMRDALDKQKRRSMRAALVSYIVMARSAAVARGCRGSVHFVSGGNSRVWVTACNAQNPAVRDTIAGPKWTEAEWDYRFLAGRDSINYDPRGLRVNFVRTAIKIRDKQDNDRDSVVVNEVGKVIYP
ncbi:MAG TPA: GspH/FimT family pseudopilin [Gemmatimonadales bacterium]|jgi:prepilin-type N-terminal cleavage/methylation domain-containing protein|nr:GspH/FimT family pseudopilin [Gemmatimonadales bacterium]